MRFEPVRGARIDAGLPQAALAQAIGRSLGWVYAVERGLTRPNQADAATIARMLGRPVEDLFTRVRPETA